MKRFLITLICFIALAISVGAFAGCSDGGSTLPEVGSDELKIDVNATRTVGYGYLSTSFYVNIRGGWPPYMVVWDFGDDTDPKIGDRVSHLYEVPGFYTCTCQVYDSSDPLSTTGGITATDFIEVFVFWSGF